MRRHDVVIVGAGPAGASLALRLARSGIAVALLDARTFPRSKPCGDAISPGAEPFLRDLGVLEAIRERHPAELHGWRLRSHRGTWFEGRFQDSTAVPAETVQNGHDARPRGPDPGSTSRPRSLSLDRLELDHVLLEAARSAGATVREGWRAYEPLRLGRRFAGVRARGPDGSPREVPARIVVGADGLRSRVARLLGRPRIGHRARLAMVARFEDVEWGAPFGELRLSGEGVLGFAPLGRGHANVTVVVPAAAAAGLSADREGFLQARLARYGLAGRLRDARLVRPPEVTGPFEMRPARRTAPGVLLIGDAAGYFDPFTGQGVYRALRSSAGAETAVWRALERPTGERRALRDYEADLDAWLRPSRRLQRCIDEIATRELPFELAARALRARPALADLLIDLTGDLQPPDALLGLRPWRALFARNDRESEDSRAGATVADGSARATAPHPGSPPVRRPSTGTRTWSGRAHA